jgi:Ca2+-binding EF-hand superfamily protein
MAGGLKNAAMMKEMLALERNLKHKLQLNYNNVRKAFLDLDKNHNGYVNAEELARLLQYGVKPQDPNKQDQDLDYSLLEYLIKMRCRQDGTELSYNKFC